MYLQKPSKGYGEDTAFIHLNKMEKNNHHYLVSKSHEVNGHEGHYHGKVPTNGGNDGRRNGTLNCTNVGSEQYLPNTYGWNDTKLYHGYTQSSHSDQDTRVEAPWYRSVNFTHRQNGVLGRHPDNQTSIYTINYFWNKTGTLYQTIYDVNNVKESYPSLDSLPCRNDPEVHMYRGNTTWTNNMDTKTGWQMTEGQDVSRGVKGQCNVQLIGQDKWNNDNYRESYQYPTYQSQNIDDILQGKGSQDSMSRKRKFPDETEAKDHIDQLTSVPRVDKRTLYSKFRVVKKSDGSPSPFGNSKVAPMLWRVKLDDNTVVDVNNEDGLPTNTKRSKVISTLTPTKLNEAAATIGNIKFITLENMKVVRRKLEVVLDVKQEEERQERLRLEAKASAKVKVDVKERMRKDRTHKDRQLHVKIGL